MRCFQHTELSGGFVLKLSVFTTTDWRVQLLCYACWGHVLVSWAFWLTAITDSSGARWIVSYERSGFPRYLTCTWKRA